MEPVEEVESQGTLGTNIYMLGSQHWGIFPPIHLIRFSIVHYQYQGCAGRRAHIFHRQSEEVGKLKASR